MGNHRVGGNRAATRERAGGARETTKSRAARSRRQWYVGAMVTSCSKGPRTKRRGDVWRPQCVPGRVGWTVAGARLERGWVRGDERGESRGGVQMAVRCLLFDVLAYGQQLSIVSCLVRM